MKIEIKCSDCWSLAMCAVPDPKFSAGDLSHLPQLLAFMGITSKFNSNVMGVTKYLVHWAYKQECCNDMASAVMIQKLF